MLRIFLSSHGKFASGLQSSCSILMGKNDRLTVFDAYIDESSVQEHLDAFYESLGPDDEALLCSDLYGGSVNQVMYTCLTRPATRLVAGVNLAFMMTVLSEGDSISDERLEEIVEESRSHLRRVELDGAVAPQAADEEDFF